MIPWYTNRTAVYFELRRFFATVCMPWRSTEKAKDGE